MTYCAKFVTLFAALALQAVNAQSSQDYSRKAVTAWAAFECSIAAGFAKIGSSEEERLFSYGYKQGTEFLVALRAGRVGLEEINKNVPWGFAFRLQGPSNDFILGRTFEAASDNATGKITKNEGKPIRNELWIEAATSRFREWNCELLGR